jgi:precorrin-3B C17-methyltransferase
VGIGPGSLDLLTPQAQKAIIDSEVVIGNASYLTALAPFLEGKEVIRSGMGDEIDRAQRAIFLAREHKVSLVSGGDAGVYGMAGIVLELLSSGDHRIKVEVIPGITAAQAVAARIGSPLSGDFVVISLSDLLTPWEVIVKRLDLAFSMGVPVVLYNPRSKERREHLPQAIFIARKYRDLQTPLAVVRNAYREGESIRCSTLGEADAVIEEVDMHSTVIVGGEESYLWKEGKHVRGIITPRGYHRKYVY